MIKNYQTIKCSKCNKQSGYTFWIENMRTQVDLNDIACIGYCDECYKQKLNNLSAKSKLYEGLSGMSMSSVESRTELYKKFCYKIFELDDYYVLDIVKNNTYDQLNANNIIELKLLNK